MPIPRPIDASTHTDEPRLLYWRDPDDRDTWCDPMVGWWLESEGWIVNDLAVKDSSWETPDAWLPLPATGDDGLVELVEYADLDAAVRARLQK